jgi:hypothetical protein
MREVFQTPEIKRMTRLDAGLSSGLPAFTVSFVDDQKGSYAGSDIVETQDEMIGVIVDEDKEGNALSIEILETGPGELEALAEASRRYKIDILRAILNAAFELRGTRIG